MYTHRVKLLSILRHAKSSWKDESLDDHDRPLNKRGTRDAPRMGALLRAQGLAPEAVISSTARRARDTSLRVAEAAGLPGEVRFTRSLYLAEPDAYLAALRELEDSIGHALVVGHNPGLEALLAALVGEQHRMPTAALALVELPAGSWRELEANGGASLRALWRPRGLRD